MFFLNNEVATSQYNLSGLRHLYDVVEAHVRVLRSLGVPSEANVGLLSSIIMSKLHEGLLKEKLVYNEYSYKTIIN